MGAVADHLWQSTGFALAAGVIALFLRNDAARVRYWIWLAASLKFLLPFALLNWLGRQFVVQVADDSSLLPIVQHVATSFATVTASVEPIGDELQQVIVALWILGSVMLLGRWLLTWLHSRALLRSSTPCAVAAPLPLPVRCTDRLDAPGIVGIVEPVLLLPTTLPARLTPAELEAVMAHEMWHVRRRDNLTAALHALVEALFWFHPLVWWIGAKLVQEREQACDEGALQEGSERTLYAGTLLKICRQSVESRLACMASAVGGDLRSRIRAIMSLPAKPQRGNLRRAVPAAALVGCLALPIASGMTVVTASGLTVPADAHSIRMTETAGPTFIVMSDDYIYGRNVSLRELIGRAYAVRGRDISGDAPWLDHPRFDIELASRHDHRQTVADLLKRQFNVELIVRPTPVVQASVK